MKKMLKTSLLLALALPVMVGCNKGPSYKETRSEEELVTDLANQVAADLSPAYSSFARNGLAYGDTALVTKVNEKVWDGDLIGLNYSVTYTLIPQEEYTKELVKLSEDGTKLVTDLVTNDDLGDFGKALGGAAYTLKASVKFDGYGENFAVKGVTPTETYVNQTMANKSFNAVAKTAKTAASLNALKASSGDGDYVLFQGRFSAWYDNSYEALYTGAFITDGDESIMIYAGKITECFFDKDSHDLVIKPGDIVQVFGAVSPYNGLYEVKPISVTKITDQSVIDSIAPTTEKAMTVTEILESDISATGTLVTVSGLKIKKLPDSMTVGGHWTITLQDTAGKELTLYVNYHIGDDAQEELKTILRGLGENDTFTFHGVLSCYNGMQISPVNSATSSAAECIVKD